MAKFRGDRPRDRGDLALNKNRKKETTAKHKGSRVALSQWVALIIIITIQRTMFKYRAEKLAYLPKSCTGEDGGGGLGAAGKLCRPNEYSRYSNIRRQRSHSVLSESIYDDYHCRDNHG